MTIRDALAQVERRLGAAGVDTPRVDAEWLVAHVLGVPRTRIHEHGNVDERELERLTRRREQREPLAYVLGEWGFRRLTLNTDRRALVPRPETEVVVERARALIANEAEPRVLDVGVGSGAIALAIADEVPAARVTGIDTSPQALELARENAERLSLRIELRRAGAEAAGEGWDLVVANPPYVAQAALAEAQPLRDDVPNADTLRYFNQEVFPTFDLRPQLEEITAPTLVVTGELDFITGPVCANEIEHSLRDVRKVLIPGSGHFVFVEAPEAFRRAVLDFLEA